MLWSATSYWHSEYMTSKALCTRHLVTRPCANHVYLPYLAYKLPIMFIYLTLFINWSSQFYVKACAYLSVFVFWTIMYWAKGQVMFIYLDLVWCQCCLLRCVKMIFLHKCFVFWIFSQMILRIICTFMNVFVSGFWLFLFISEIIMYTAFIFLTCYYV